MKSVLCTIGILVAAMPVWADIEAAKPGTFAQEVGVFLRDDPALPTGPIYAVAFAPNGAVVAGTNEGLQQRADTNWTAVSDVPSEPVLCLAESHSTLYAATATELYRIQADGAVGRPAVLPESPTALAAAENHDVWIGTRNGLFLANNGRPVIDQKLSVLLGNEQAIAQIAVRKGGQVAVAAQAGLFIRESGAWQRLLPRAGNRSWAVVDARGVAYDTRGALWFCSPQGVGRYDGAWTLITGREGLPYDDFTGVYADGGGALWFGTTHGAIRYDGTHWAYREGLRWLPDNHINGIAVAPDGAAWFATNNGVGLIERRPMTLGEKAQFYEDEIDIYHRRTPYEYVQWVSLAAPGDKSQWRQRDDDNDGQWTGEYGAAECFRYGATGDPEAKARATKAFEALRFLSQVTQGGSHPAPKGFPARTIWPTNDPRNPNSDQNYSVEADEEERDTSDALWKVIHPRWPTNEDGKWYWKCDTSSDELDGHYFLNACYYDLVAETEEEKDRVREVVRDMTDHLLANDFRLVDHDGKPTRWANYSPNSLNHDPHWWAERGLNSLSILSYLRTASHITGDPKYDAVADRLIEEEGYVMNAMYPKLQRGPGSYVQFDDEMAMMCYYNLLKYEKDPRRRGLFAKSLHGYWELEEPETNPFYNFVYAASCQGVTLRTQWGVEDFSPPQSAIDDAVDTLMRYPIDLVSWKMTNSHRIDLVPLSPLVREGTESEGKGSVVNGKVLPLDERFITYWSDDAWELDTGANGEELATGMPYLLAYFMGLYHGFIVEE